MDHNITSNGINCLYLYIQIAVSVTFHELYKKCIKIIGMLKNTKMVMKTYNNFRHCTLYFLMSLM